MDRFRLLPLGLVFLYTLKVLILGAQLPDSFILLGLMALYGFIAKQQKDSAYDELKNDMALLRKELEEKTQGFNEVKSKVASMQISSGMKQRG